MLNNNKNNMKNIDLFRIESAGTIGIFANFEAPFEIMRVIFENIRKCTDECQIIRKALKIPENASEKEMIKINSLKSTQDVLNAESGLEFTEINFDLIPAKTKISGEQLFLLQLMSKSNNFKEKK